MLRDLRRLGWFALGWTAVALGVVGIVVPGLPTTGFFVLAAASFARSSPRFEQWVLDLPKVGPLVRDYRAGLGMPRRAKVMAIAMMLTACSISSVVTGSAGGLGLDRRLLRDLESPHARGRAQHKVSQRPG